MRLSIAHLRMAGLTAPPRLAEAEPQRAIHKVGHAADLTPEFHLIGDINEGDAMGLQGFTDGLEIHPGDFRSLGVDGVHSPLPWYNGGQGHYPRVVVRS